MSLAPVLKLQASLAGMRYPLAGSTFVLAPRRATWQPRAMSVADNFRAFRANYLIPSTTVGTISYRYKRITKQLNKDFWNTESETAHSLYVGSYGRDTAANGVSDLDVAFTLPNSVYQKYNAYQTNGQSALLQKVKQSIGCTYSTSYVGADGQIIAVNFDDGIRFEFLPVFVNTSNTFTFADSKAGGSWKTCNPRDEMAKFAVRNTVTANGNLKVICRMARIWRDRHSVPMGGMLIDTLAYQFIAGWAHCDKSYLYHDYLVRDYLLYLSQIDTSQTYWRAPGSGSYAFKRGNFQRQAGVSYKDVLSAIEHEANNRPTTARNKWREVFGPTYP